MTIQADAYSPPRSHPSAMRKVLVAIFILYLTATVVMTVIQMYLEYDQAKGALQDQLIGMGKIIQPSLAEALANEEYIQVENILLDLQQSPIVVDAQVVVEYSDGDALSIDTPQTTFEGYQQTDKRVQGAVVSMLSRRIQVIVPLTFLDQQLRATELGRVMLYSSDTIMFQSLKYSWLVLLVSNCIKIAILWLCGLWAGHRYISYPLQRLAQAAKLLAQRHYEQAAILLTQPHYDGSDLDQLTHTFYNMSQQIHKQDHLLQEGQRVLREMLNQLPFGICCIGENRLITEWNLGMAAITKVKRELAVNRTLQAVYEPFEQYLQSCQAAKMQGQPTLPKREQVTCDAEEKIYEYQLYPINYPTFSGCMLRVQDVTLQVRHEDAMVREKKLHALGEMACGVAHELNNPLGAIVQSSQNILRRLEPDNAANQKVAAHHAVDLNGLQRYLKQRKVLEFIEGIRGSGERCAHIIQTLRQLAPGLQEGYGMHHLEAILNQAIASAQSNRFEGGAGQDFKRILFLRECEPDLPEVWCHPHSLEHALINLFCNAAVAMRDKLQPIIKCQLAQVEGGVVLTVSDCGEGVSPDKLSKLFEPFYSSRPPGEGIGLGLTIVYNIIVDKHGGHIEARPVPEGGLSIVCHLPIQNKSVAGVRQL